MITTNGKKTILNANAGYIGSFAKSIVLGVGTTAAAVGDTELEFEAIRLPISSATPDYVNQSIMYRAQWDALGAANIYEIGIRSEEAASADFGSRSLFYFDPTAELWTGNVSQTSTNVRVSGNGMLMNPNASTTQTVSITSIGMDFTNYGGLDVIKLAYYVANANTSNIVMKFYTDLSNYYTLTISAPAAGYRISSVLMSAATVTGAPTWSNITQVDVSTTSTAGGASSVTLDGLRIEDRDSTIETDVLVTRTILGSPIVKTNGVPLDIEFTVDFTL